uniref:Uncharacterized protein LOC111119528 n=1 Tax=Crassostrea virginica TaxID=6565 RepID=A0A8B8CJT9_CRAVI|nr:uncharacterized protein LOC111119528 [Crassostrea virginica]
MGQLIMLFEFFLAFCMFSLFKCEPLYHKEPIDITKPFTKDIPWSARNLFRKFMKSLETINNDKKLDISFHTLERVDDGFEFDLRDILADPSVTGVDIFWPSPSKKSCHIKLGTSDYKLEGKRTNGFIFYDFDHVLSLGLSSSLVRVRPVLPLACSAEDSPFYAFLVIYRNISKGLVLQEIDNARDSRFKRDAKDNEPNKVKKNQDLGCQLIPWTVDFARLSSFIVAPLKYNANSCQGHCGQREKGFDRMTRKTLTNYELLRVFLLGKSSRNTAVANQRNMGRRPWRMLTPPS